MKKKKTNTMKVTPKKISLHTAWSLASGDPETRKKYAKQIAARLIATREVMEMSQAEFCRRAGINQPTYNQYEKAVNVPEPQWVLRIRDAFGIPLDWVYCGDASSLPHRIAKSIPQSLII